MSGETSTHDETRKAIQDVEELLLAALDLVRLVEERPRRGLTERVMVASARSYVLAPAVLGKSARAPLTSG